MIKDLIVLLFAGLDTFFKDYTYIWSLYVSETFKKSGKLKNTGNNSDFLQFLTGDSSWLPESGKWGSPIGRELGGPKVWKFN